MATQRPALHAGRSEFAGRLLAEREAGPRAQAIAEEAAALTGASVAVYLYNAAAAPRWSSKASSGEVTPPGAGEALTLHMLAERQESLLFAGQELVREHYSHLDVRRTVVAMAYVPMALEGKLLGAIEAISFERVLDAADLEALGGIAELSAVALASALSYEDERNASLQSITRLTEFYDLEKVFHSTLQMPELMPIITAKIRELIAVQAVNLWMVDEDDLILMSRSGVDPTLELGATADELIEFVSDKGSWVMVHAPSEPRLQARNARAPGEEPAIRNLMATPIIHGGALVGALECINKAEGARFNEDDLFFLKTVADSAALALHNASLLDAERKIEILETLVEVSSEITSTLNLERVLQVVVNGPQRIMAYDRAAIALDVKGKLQVKAISGKTSFLPQDPAVRQLRELLEFCAISSEPVYVTMSGDEVYADREETRIRFREYFGGCKSRAWYSVPLADDQGRLGILSFESADINFLAEVQFEFIKVIASQATVAIRNASLYEEVPLIGVLQPLAQKKQRFMRMEKRRRAATVALAVAIAAFLAFFPIPMRVAGDASVAAQNTSQIQAEVDGTVHNVYVREGDHVAKGAILADMNDWDYRAAVAAAQAKYAIAVAAMNRALANSDGTEAGIERVQADYWTAEVIRAKERLERTRLRSPIDGIVATPHIENLAGRKLQAGDTVAQVINSARADVDVAVEESDIPLVEAGDAAAVKLDGFPTRKFHGKVEVLSPTSGLQGEKRVFYARVQVPNADGALRPGMSGLAKISTGWRPAGYVLFRGVGMSAWAKVWKWFGW